MIVDAAMNDLIRPTLYEAYHDVVNVIEPAPDAARQTRRCRRAGLRERRLSGAKKDDAVAASGDLLAVMSAGAYGAVQAIDL